MIVQYYKPNSKNTGCAFSFDIGSNQKNNETMKEKKKKKYKVVFEKISGRKNSVLRAVQVKKCVKKEIKALLQLIK